MDKLTENQINQKSILINRALGMFLVLFGLIVIIAVPFSDSLVDKLTNLIAGLIIFGIGAGMFLVARKNMKSLKEKDPEVS